MYQTECGEQEMPAWEEVEEFVIMRGKMDRGMDEVICGLCVTEGRDQRPQRKKK